VADTGHEKLRPVASVERRRSPRRGNDRRNLATRVPGVWTEEERQRFRAERSRSALESGAVGDDNGTASALNNALLEVLNDPRRI
jgi:hypothetical protein